MSTGLTRTNLSVIDESIMDPNWYTSMDYLDGLRQLRDEDPDARASDC